MANATREIKLECKSHPVTIVSKKDKEKKIKKVFSDTNLLITPPKNYEFNATKNVNNNGRVQKAAKKLLNLGNYLKNPINAFKQQSSTKFEKVRDQSDRDLNDAKVKYNNFYNQLSEHKEITKNQRLKHEHDFPKETKRPTVISNELDKELNELTPDEFLKQYTVNRDNLIKNFEKEDEFVGYNPKNDLPPETPNLTISDKDSKADLTQKGTIASRGYQAMWQQIHTVEDLMHSFFDRMEANNNNIALLDRLKQILSLSEGEINWKKDPELNNLFNEAAKLGLKLPTKDTLNDEDRHRLMQNIDSVKDTFVGANESAQLRMQMYQNSLKFLYECLSNFNKFFHDICTTFSHNLAIR